MNAAAILNGMTTAERTALGRRDALALLREHREELAERFGVRRLALFGSTARDEAGPDSDVDVLAAFDHAGMHEYGGALEYLQELMGPRVDLIVESELRAEFRPYVEADAIYVMPELPPPSRRENRPMPERLWDCYVRDMIEACEKVLTYAEGMDAEALLADDRTFNAVCFNIIVIGEAVTHIPAHVHEAHPEIPWGKLAGTRDHVVHEYWKIDHGIICGLVEDDIPALLPPLRGLLEASS